MGIDYYKTLGDTSFITGRHARTALGIIPYIVVPAKILPSLLKSSISI